MRKIINSTIIFFVLFLFSISVSAEDISEEYETEITKPSAFTVSDNETMKAKKDNNDIILHKALMTVDLNNDSKTTSADARLLLRHSAKLELYKGNTGSVDINADGSITALDARLALRYSANLDTYYRLADGSVAYGIFTTNDNRTFILSETGAASDGFVTVDGDTYYCEKGFTVTGIKTIDGVLCYFDNNGKGVTGEHTVDGTKVQFKNGVSTSGYKTVNGQKLYYVNGNPANGLTKISSDTYLFNNGVMQQGWQNVGNEYYHFDRADGRLIKNTTVDGIKVDAEGKAQKTAYNTEKIKTFMKARAIMLRETEPDDTVEEKKLKCFRWVMSCPYRQYRGVGQSVKISGWEMKFANDIFDNGNGCCGSTTGAFAFLAVECGCKDVYFCDDGVSSGGHAWVIMEGNNRVYDIIFAKSKSFDANYDSDVNDYRKFVPRKTYIGG